MFCIVNNIDPLDLKEDDNESDCSDSWELLDYEEETNNENNNKTKESKPDASSSKPEKKTSATAADVAATVGSKKATRAKANKTKQKVSFEIPDLVKEKEKHTIELTTPKEAASKQSKQTGPEKTTDADTATIATISQTEKPTISQTVGTTITSENKKKRKNKNKNNNDNADIIQVKPVAPVKEAQAQLIARAPIQLNYAAALAAKLDNNNGICNKKPEKKSETLPKSDATTTEVAPIATQSKSVTKRNRPVSSSSWSSCDDDENIKEISLVWEDSDEVLVKEIQDVEIKTLDVLELPTDNNNDDNDSIVSSGFSDCDYGFGGLNDYVMRPKKAQTKRRRNASSTSSSLLTSLAKRGSERAIDSSCKRSSEVVKESKSKDLASKQSTSSRHIKPKKKKLVLSQPTTQSDFLRKSVSGNETSQVIKKSALLDQAPKRTSNVEVETSRVDETKEQALLMPPPSTVPPTSSTSSNDSSDIPDMDESWYLTPPPCFTGAAAGKSRIISKPKAKEAARENLLIEHPSIYIASTSSQAGLAHKRSTKEILIKQKAIVLKKISRQQASSSKLNSSQVTDEKKIAAKAIPKPLESKKAKCWDNKFVVANWADDDDQGDVDDDFDNLFPVLDQKQLASVTSKKSTAEKSKKSSKTEKVSKQFDNKFVKRASQSSDSYDSDFSIPSPSPVEEPVVVNQPSHVNGNGLVIVETENVEPKRCRKKSSSSEPKAPVKVEPIAPERQPGWQLKKKRSPGRRRPLATTAPVTPISTKRPISQAANGKQSLPLQSFAPPGELSYPGGAECSVGCTPTFINRIGSSIVANLSNLTSGFASSTGMNMQARAPMNEVNEKIEHLQLIRKSESGLNLKARKQMTKASMNRQNNCLIVGSSARRADRRTKMRTTPSGKSVNRKVHTNFH